MANKYLIESGTWNGVGGPGGSSAVAELDLVLHGWAIRFISWNTAIRTRFHNSNLSCVSQRDCVSLLYCEVPTYEVDIAGSEFTRPSAPYADRKPTFAEITKRCSNIPATYWSSALARVVVCLPAAVVCDTVIAAPHWSSLSVTKFSAQMVDD